MTLITKEVETGLDYKTIKHYEELGYKIPKHTSKYGEYVVIKGTKIIVKVEDLLENSGIKVIVKCDCCGKILGKENEGIPYSSYRKNLKEDDKYYCIKCAQKLYGGKKRTKTNIKNGMSFEQWCINNKKQEILNRWDYDKNNCAPSEINYTTDTKYYFKCPNNVHDSEQKSIRRFTYGYNGSMNCIKCNSLGIVFPKSIRLWSGKNKMSPFEYTPKNRQSVWWKCQNGIHEDFYRSILNSVNYNFRCPQCQHSKGEEIILQYLKYNNIKYESQKTFDGLVGIGNGMLSYDFYLPDYNLLIEYNGEQHKMPVAFDKKRTDTVRKFKIQQIHDYRKNRYAELNNISILTIWYYNIDNIEVILNELI